LKIQNDINLKFKNKINKKLKIGIYTYSLINGGLQRLTSLMLKYFDKMKIYEIYLFTQLKKQSNEYTISKNITRIVISKPRIKNLINQVILNDIDILIYNFYFPKEINILNNLKNIKVIFYIHQSIFYWIYFKYNSFKSLYTAYQNSKYVISLVPFENDYLFKKWGIRSILMYNYISYEYDSVIPSDLSSKIILMLGRAFDKLKRFDLGIISMKYIVKEIPDCKMNIVSKVFLYDPLKKLVNKLKLSNFIKFLGYSSKPEIHFKNASLHIFPSISEAFPMVLSETKIYGIPNILIGLDYLSLSRGGTIIVYDDNPVSIAKEAIKILKNYTYRKKLGKEARESMKQFRNELILKKWNQLILSIYNGDNYYQILRDKGPKISENYSMKLIKGQINLLKKRKKIFNNITLQDLCNFTKMQNMKI
jgi:glycosyltransferase involved in cell wall biosynthesis